MWSVRFCAGPSDSKTMGFASKTYWTSFQAALAVRATSSGPRRRAVILMSVFKDFGIGFRLAFRRQD
ncbi:hypothetical protein BLA27_16535 [Brucella cytisi]|uniref:Uncharacterized protein n=1 Tax=Brucella cytisi TaxID=407152 RepID=A0A1J6HHB6_9HYPH|nr:hypothetical protein BLA27_16535 [Brucella cytisi]